LTQTGPPLRVNPEELIRSRLHWLVLLRVVVSLLLLGGTLLLQAREPADLIRPPLVGPCGILALVLALSLIYRAILPRVRNLRSFAYTQVIGDIVLVTALVYLTGSEESIFASTYNLSIITGSILLYRRGGLIAASLSSLLYGGMLNLRFFSVLPQAFKTTLRSSQPLGSEVFFSIMINVSAFFIVALLSSYLAEQAKASREELEVAQSDLSRLTLLHEHILQCLPSGLLTCDSQGRIIYANQSALSMMGTELQSILHKPLEEVFPQIPSRLFQEAARGVHDPQMRRQNMKYTRPDGRVLELGFSLAPLRGGDGALMGTIFHFQDLTQTVAMEQHLRRMDKLASIGEMAARIAHEIRNPLASVSGSIQILQKELSLEGPNRRLMEIVVRETKRLNGLLTDFLSFARPEHPKPKKMDLSKALRETLTLFMEQARSSCELKVQISPGLIIYADSKKLRQVVWNLLNNALEAMPQGGNLTVRASWASGALPAGLDTQETWLVMEVEDSGVGIPEEVKDKVFDPFFTTKEKGTGLGLSIVHRLVEEMGGRIEMQSQPGKGSRFMVWLPSGSIPQEEEHGAEPEHTAPKPT
jgi:two-component system sensor histidine kinase PilS (NtrC family)